MTRNSRYKPDRHRDQEDFERKAEHGVAPRTGVVGHDQSEHGQGDGDAQEGTGALQIVLLLLVPQAAQQQRQARAAR